VAITGAHALLYTPEAEALRATLRDVFGWHHVDAGDGWLIFALPPAELGVHPSDGATKHELSLMCDDVRATVAELRAQGIEFRGEPEDMGFGTGLTMLLPGGVEVLLYEPQHQTAIGRSRAEAAG
jgi:catechol 2,3-dioxygenase-like lactoylglutathione lyase family enzyme